MKRGASRRALLRGAGVALALPWLESLTPRAVQAQAPAPRKRFLPILLPNGAHHFWTPVSSGMGTAWQLSSILEPFGAVLKPKLTVITGLENGSVFNANGAPYVEPSHSRLCGGWLTCVDAVTVRAELGVGEANGISVDQVLAQHPQFLNQTPLPSLQVGLSTPLSICDGEPCSSSRSVSWSGAQSPMYKLVDPLEVFNRIVGVTSVTAPSGESSAEADKRRARNQSVLDAVLENAQRTRSRLGASDRQRMDEFLEAVRGVERRVTGVSTGLAAGCGAIEPSALLRAEQSAVAPRQTTESYDKGLHADVMNDLIALAFECDVTRIISYMLEDERSEFIYDHVEERTFTAESSSLKGGPCPEYHAAQHGPGDAFATITWWNVGKVAELCRKLDAIEEAPGVSVLDNTVVLFAGCMEGGSHRANDLPVALIGGTGLGLKTDQHLVLENRPLRDLYFTLMNQVFALNVADFGQNLTQVPASAIESLV